MLNDVWMPLAARYEIPISEFWKLNPRKLSKNLPYYAEQQKRKLQDEYNSAWMMGQYIAMAITACFSKGAKYPESPENIYEREMTDEDKVANAAARFRASALKDNEKRFGVASFNDERLKGGMGDD